MKALQDLFNVPSQKVQVAPKTVGVLPPMSEQLNALWDDLEWIKNAQERIYELTHFQDDTVQLIRKYTYSGFQRLISNTHTSDITLNIKAWHGGTDTETFLGVYNRGWGSKKSKSDSIEILFESEYDRYEDWNRKWLEMIFYSKRAEIAGWLATLNNRDKAVYKYHQLFSDALKDFFEYTSSLDQESREEMRKKLPTSRSKDLGGQILRYPFEDPFHEGGGARHGYHRSSTGVHGNGLKWLTWNLNKIEVNSDGEIILHAIGQKEIQLDVDALSNVVVLSEFMPDVRKICQSMMDTYEEFNKRMIDIRKQIEADLFHIDAVSLL